MLLLLVYGAQSVRKIHIYRRVVVVYHAYVLIILNIRNGVFLGLFLLIHLLLLSDLLLLLLHDISW